MIEITIVIASLFTVLIGIIVFLRSSIKHLNIENNALTEKLTVLNRAAAAIKEQIKQEVIADEVSDKSIFNRSYFTD